MAESQVDTSQRHEPDVIPKPEKGPTSLVIISHTLYCKLPDGEIEIPIHVHQPVKGEKDWSCIHEIGWPEGPEKRAIYGLDALQALVLTLQFIGTMIYTSDYHKEGRLRAYEKEKGYGFPVPSSMRDMLVGADAI